MTKNQNIDLLEALHQSILARGYWGTLKLLVIEKKQLQFTEYEKYVLDEISKRFHIENPEEVIREERNYRGHKMYYIAFLIYYWYANASIGEIHKRIMFQRTLSMVSVYKKMINDLNPKYETDMQYVALKKELDELFKDKM